MLRSPRVLQTQQPPKLSGASQWVLGRAFGWGEGEELAEKAGVDYGTVRTYGLVADGYEKDLDRIYAADDLANGQNIIFCATGISDSALLPGVRARGGVTAVTHSILMRAKSKTVRFIRARHDLQIKTIRLRSDNREHIL